MRLSTWFRLMLGASIVGALFSIGSARPVDAVTDHLVISELATGGTSASDELIEIYNPADEALPVEGLELVYITSSGATVTRRAAWDTGEAPLPPGGHLLVAHELGIYAAIADATYGSGMAATGGSVALRIQGAVTAIDAVGWGTAAGSWLEGGAAAAPPAGSSIERLPGGSAGSTQDTHDNAADFVVRVLPDPQNRGSAPVPDPLGAPTPTPTPTAAPTPTPTPAVGTPPPATPTPAAPAPASVSVAAARSLPDGSSATIEGDALTGATFSDGGGYVADESAGIAVIVDGGGFERGERVRIRGVISDRYAQRTLRAVAADVEIIGTGVAPAAVAAATGAIGETHEATLLRIAGNVVGSGTMLSGAIAFDVDDGGGVVRVVVGSETGIATDSWGAGRSLTVVGVLGQRDSSGTGTAGYRLQPRDAQDVSVGDEATPQPTASAPAGASPTPSAAPSDGDVISIASARVRAKNAKVIVRGVVTLPSGIVDASSAAIQDASGAILIRLGDRAGRVELGALLEVQGTRSTKSGMETLRVTVSPRRLGTTELPPALPMRTGDAAESREAQLVIVRGALVASARRASSGSVTVDVDDGSGPLRVYLGAELAADPGPLAAGAWVEVRGILGQETTGALPQRGYRVWPAAASDVRVVAVPTGSSGGGDGSSSTADGGGGVAGVALDVLGRADLADLRVGATLVSTAWPELEVSGLLWDGSRLVAIGSDSEARLDAVAGGAGLPISLELEGLHGVGVQPQTGIRMVELGRDAGQTVVGVMPVAAPLAALPAEGSDPAWISLVGRMVGDGSQPMLQMKQGRVRIEILCRRPERIPNGPISITGIALSSPARLVIGCDAIRRAPSLAMVAHLTRERLVVEPLSSPGAVDISTGEPQRWLGAALVLAGGLAGVAITLGRRFGARVAAAARVETRSVDDTLAGSPALTLVRRTREHES